MPFPVMIKRHRLPFAWALGMVCFSASKACVWVMPWRSRHISIGIWPRLRRRAVWRSISLDLDGGSIFVSCFVIGVGWGFDFFDCSGLIISLPSRGVMLRVTCSHNFLSLSTLSSFWLLSSFSVMIISITLCYELCGLEKE